MINCVSNPNVGYNIGLNITCYVSISHSFIIHADRFKKSVGRVGIQSTNGEPYRTLYVIVPARNHQAYPTLIYNTLGRLMGRICEKEK